MSPLDRKLSGSLRWIGTGAVAAGLFVGSLGIASAATSHRHAEPPHRDLPHSLHHGDRPNTPADHRADELSEPHLGGRVVAIGEHTVTVADHDGFWRTIRSDDTTTYTDRGAATTRSAVTIGSFVAARGTVNSDHVSLDAQSIDLMPEPPHGHDGPDFDQH